MGPYIVVHDLVTKQQQQLSNEVPSMYKAHERGSQGSWLHYSLH